MTVVVVSGDTAAVEDGTPPSTGTTEYDALGMSNGSGSASLLRGWNGKAETNKSNERKAAAVELEGKNNIVSARRIISDLEHKSNISEIEFSYRS
jgi:hypothetical protein